MIVGSAIITDGPFLAVPEVVLTLSRNRSLKNLKNLTRFRAHMLESWAKKIGNREFEGLSILAETRGKTLTHFAMEMADSLSDIARNFIDAPVVRLAAIKSLRALSVIDLEVLEYTSAKLREIRSEVFDNSPAQKLIDKSLHDLGVWGEPKRGEFRKTGIDFIYAC